MTELHTETITNLSYSLWGWPKPADLIKIISLFPEDASLKIEVDHGAMTPLVNISTRIVVS